MGDDTMVFTVDLRSISTEVFQEVDALLAEIERERDQGGPPYTVPPCPDQLAHLIVDGVISRHLAETLGASTASTSPPTSAGPSIVETRWMPLTYDEVREVNRALARRDRDRDRGPAFDGGCAFPMGGTPFALKAGERVLTRADRPHATAREVADRLSRPKVTTREVAERFENTLKKEP